MQHFFFLFPNNIVNFGWINEKLWDSCVWINRKWWHGMLTWKSYFDDTWSLGSWNPCKRSQRHCIHYSKIKWIVRNWEKWWPKMSFQNYVQFDGWFWWEIFYINILLNFVIIIIYILLLLFWTGLNFFLCHLNEFYMNLVISYYFDNKYITLVNYKILSLKIWYVYKKVNIKSRK